MMPRRHRLPVLPLALCVAVLANASPASARPAGVSAPIPGTGCTVFPADNIWNTKIKTLAVHAKSKTWMATIKASTTKLHPDFGAPPYGLPFAVVDNGHPTVSITFDYPDESDPGPYPFGSDIPVEEGSDAHALMVNGDTCTLYELFAADWNNGDPTAGSGAIFDLTSNALRTDQWTSADAAGLPILPGLVRYDEVEAGAINHAIRFTAALTDCHHLWPARHDAGTCNSSYPKMGARLRLKASFSLTGFSEQAKVILRAMKNYGIILADNGSNFFFQGTEDGRWTDSLLDELKSVKASNLEVVDESVCKVSADSGQAACP
jgi:hypothetical protein